MSVRASRRQPDSGLVIPRLVWRDAEHRLLLMEESARALLRKPGSRMARLVVQVTQRPPILLPARIGDVLFGPDGMPLIKES